MSDGTFTVEELAWLKHCAMGLNTEDWTRYCLGKKEHAFPSGDPMQDGAVPEKFKGRLFNAPFMIAALAALEKLEKRLQDAHEEDMKKRTALWTKILAAKDLEALKTTLTAEELALWDNLSIDEHYEAALSVQNNETPRPENCVECLGRGHIPGADPCWQCTSEDGGSQVEAAIAPFF